MNSRRLLHILSVLLWGTGEKIDESGRAGGTGSTSQYLTILGGA